VTESIPTPGERDRDLEQPSGRGRGIPDRSERDRDLVELEELEQEVAALQRELEAPLDGDDGVTEPLFSDFSES
jgi:hypothetical protein